MVAFVRLTTALVSRLYALLYQLDHQGVMHHLIELNALQRACCPKKLRSPLVGTMNTQCGVKNHRRPRQGLKEFVEEMEIVDGTTLSQAASPHCCGLGESGSCVSTST